VAREMSANASFHVVFASLDKTLRLGVRSFSPSAAPRVDSNARPLDRHHLRDGLQQLNNDAAYQIVSSRMRAVAAA
jgi:hypothetical protein